MIRTVTSFFPILGLFVMILLVLSGGALAAPASGSAPLTVVPQPGKIPALSRQTSPAAAGGVMPVRKIIPNLVSGATHLITVEGTLSFQSVGITPPGGCSAVKVRVFRRAGGGAVSNATASGGGMSCGYKLTFPFPTSNLADLEIEASQELQNGYWVEWSKNLTGWSYWPGTAESQMSGKKVVNFSARSFGLNPNTTPDIAISHLDSQLQGQDTLALKYKISNPGKVPAGAKLEVSLGKPCTSLGGANGDWLPVGTAVLPAQIAPGSSINHTYLLSRYVGRGCTVRAVVTPVQANKLLNDVNSSNNKVDTATQAEQRADLYLDTYYSNEELYFSVKNGGEISSPATKFVYDCTGTKTVCNPPKHLERDVPSLAPGAMYRSDIAVKWYPKDWHWAAVVDPSDTVMEWDDFDNNRTHSK